MTNAPQIFDRRQQRLRLTRAERLGYADFLLARVCDELAERLAAVKRSFTRALDLGTPHRGAVAALAASGQVEHVLRAAPILDLSRPAPSGAAAVVADEELIPFAPKSFDLVVSLLALHGVNDLPGTLAQIRRCLVDDGLFIGCLFGGGTLSELRAAFATAEAEVEGGVSPRVAPFADLRDVGALLQRAGLALPVTDVDTLTVRYDNAFALMRDLRAMGLTNTLAERRRTPLRRATLMRAAAIYAERFAMADGRIPATFDIVWLSGWAPHESQQKPLRPGSAKMRLADALKGLEPPGEGKDD